MKHVKLFENWEEEVIIPEAEDLMDKGDEEMADEAGSEEEAEEEGTEEEATEEAGSWESLKGDILDKYKNGEMTKDEAINALG